MITPLELKREIWKQFGSDLVSPELDFAVGYMKGNSKMSIISPVDIQDVWTSVDKGDSTNLWCEKVRVSKRKANDDSGSNSDSDDGDGGTSVYKSKKKKRKKKKRKLSFMEEKNDRIESIISSLREKHGDKFSMIQYRMWSELIDNGKHKQVQ